MKHLFLLVTVLVSMHAQAQQVKPLQKMLIGFSFSPDYSFRTLKNEGSSGGPVLQTRNDIEIPKFGYTTGVNLCINFSQKAALETGIQFSNRGYKNKEQEPVLFPPDPNAPSKISSQYTYQYLGIPIKAKFSFGKNKVRFVTGIGFISNFLFYAGYHVQYEYSDGRTEKKQQTATSSYNKLDISATCSAGIDYRLNDKIHLIAEPAFRYGLIKTKDAPMKENLWSAGINLGFYRALR